MTPRSTRVLFFLILTLIGSATLLAGAEAAYRFHSSRRAGRGVQIRYYPHAKLEHAMVRDTDYRGVVHINRFGFRGADFDSAKAAGTTRVILIGASTTFDPCARRDSETWAARLEHWLNELAPARRFQVINAGVPGVPMLEQLIRLETELYAFDPDVFVVYAGHGIVSASDARLGMDPKSRTPDAATKSAPRTTWLANHSRLYERLRQQRGRAATDVVLTEEQWTRAVDNAARDFERYLTSFTLIARSMGADVVMTEINTVTGGRSPTQFTNAELTAWRQFGTPPEVVFAGYDRFNAIWQSVADKAGATFIPADSLRISGPENYCDAIHFSPAGSEIMGRRLAEQLLANGVLTRQPNFLGKF